MAAYLEHLEEITDGGVNTEVERDALSWAVDLALYNGELADRVEVQVPGGRSFGVKDVRQHVERLEARKVELAKRTLERLKKEHAKLTRNWVLGLEDMTPAMKDATREAIAENEGEQKRWEGMTTSIFDRVADLTAKLEARREAVKKLVAEAPGIEARQRGEAIRRLVKSVTLFWSAKPGPKKTRHVLQRDKTRVVYADCKMPHPC